MTKKKVQTLLRFYMVMLVPVSMIYVLFFGYPPEWTALIAMLPMLIELAIDFKEITCRR